MDRLYGWRGSVRSASGETSRTRVARSVTFRLATNPMRVSSDRPLCRPEDLGRPIPDSPHAVSVCLPTWADNVGYEQGDPRVVGRMQCGYPRFFLNPSVVRLFQACEDRFAKEGECCFVLPSPRVAERCVDFVRREKGIE